MSYSRIGEALVQTLWDSGAGVTIISKACYDCLVTLGVRMVVLPKLNAPLLTCATGTVAEPEGYVEIRIDLNTKQYVSVRCWILSGLTSDLIIGSDTMNRLRT